MALLLTIGKGNKMRALTCFSLHLLVIILLTLCHVLTAEHITIKPTGGDHHECEAYTNPCKTFSHYISNDPSIFNNSNTSIEFLQGAHNVGGYKEQHILIKGLHVINWYGDTSQRTEIICLKGVTFVFADITILSIRDLQFFNCGHYLPSVLSEHVQHSRRKGPKSSYSKISATLVLANVISLHLERVNIQQSFGYGLLGLNILGQSQILSCSFLENNEKCKQIISNTHYCAGGNAMLLFFDTMKLETVLPTATVLINNSRFYKGNDFSSKTIKDWCSGEDDADIPNRANGLGIIIEQQTYRVHLSLEWVNFTGNIGSGNHPAVLFNDYSGVTNNITVTNCLFKNDGTFKLALVDNDDCNSGETKFCYKDNHVERPHISEVVTIRHSTFINGSGNGLLICTKPNYQRENSYQRITILGCVFTMYRQTRPLFHVSALRIIYSYGNKKACPSINILVEKTSFVNNHIPSTTCLLWDLRQYIDNIESPCLQLLINKCTYSKSVSYDSTVILDTGGRPNLLEYGNGTKGSGNKSVALDRVKISNTRFTNNICTGGRWNPRVILAVKHVYTIIDSCVFRNSIGTSVMARYAVIRMKGRNDFLNNSGDDGGGIALIYSIVLLMPNSTTNIVGNNATYGGGIFADPLRIPNFYSLTNTSVDALKMCPFRFPVHNSGSDTNISIKLVQNKAYYAGDSIYGALYDKCYITNQCYGKNRHELKCTFTEKNYKEHSSQFFQFEWRTTHEISSIPNRLCICSNANVTNQCAKKYVNTYPGETINISLAAVGQLNGTTRAFAKGTVCEYFNRTCKPSNFNDISRGPSGHTLSAFGCRNLTYTVNSLRSQIKIQVQITKPIRLNPFVIIVNILPCPAGFKRVNKHGEIVHCECLDYLIEKNIQCNIDLGKIKRPAEKWIGYHPIHPDNITVHDNCPFDYCMSGETYMYTNLSVPDEQCNYKRSGVLCGACQSNMSLELGSSNCKQCSNIYLLLILPFTLAGLALVVLLLKCNLTVSTGHINAIIFYANIVQVNKAALFPTQDTTYRVFSTFIAWLNLDLGIETCFYENMDAHGKVWLQFVFPVYLWLLIGLIVVLANYSTRAARLIGNNSVPVLATLFILSYAKMLRTIIASVSFTYIQFQDGTYVPVWLQDGNVKYFSPKHIPLFTVAILFTITYIVPLTLIVLFAPCLQARTHYKPLKWVNRLKPFLDAYQGPYNDKYRFWTGLLLIARTILFVIFASNYDVDPAMNFFWIVMLAGPIGMFVLVRKNHTVYRNGFANMLEIISLLNIIVLSTISWLLTTTKYKKWASGRKYATYISVGITGLLFLVIVTYQISHKFISKICTGRKIHQNRDEPVIEEMTVPAPTQSIVEISHSESLIETLLDKQATDL